MGCITVVNAPATLCGRCADNGHAIHLEPQPPVTRCIGYRQGHQCDVMPTDDGRCRRCALLRAQRILVLALLDEVEVPPLRDWQTVARDFYRRARLGEFSRVIAWSASRRYALRRGVDIATITQFLGEIVAPAQQQEGLARFVNDSQNVHTRHVSTQTNKGMQILLNTPIPEEQSTLHDITFRWMLAGTFHRMNQLGSLLIDMDTFYQRDTCRTEGDFLYRHVLDGLQAIITVSPHRDELSRRLYEEVLDSAGLCMDGHITRLVNVLVGFHPDFASPTSVIEVLGDRFAALAAVTDLSAETRRERGLAILTELGIPDYDHAPWLDAL